MRAHVGGQHFLLSLPFEGWVGMWWDRDVLGVGWSMAQEGVLRLVGSAPRLEPGAGSLRVPPPAHGWRVQGCFLLRVATGPPLQSRSWSLPPHPLPFAEIQ